MGTPLPNYDSPFARLYAFLWDAVIAHPWAGLIQPKNRIRFDSDDRSIIKERVQDADAPELMLLQCNGTHDLHQDSAGAYVEKKIQWLVSTLDLRINDRLYAVEWMLFEAMVAADKDAHNLTWNDQPFVTKFDLQDATEGISDPDRNRGIRGWSACLSVVVGMRFLTAAMPTGITGGS